MISVPYAIALALGSALVTVAASWGIMQTQLKALNTALDDLRGVPVALAELRVTLSQGKERVEALERWRDSQSKTGPHAAVRQ